MAYRGPDISAWQGNIDIKNLAKWVDFFIFRAYAGGKDKKVDRNVKLSIEANKPYGLYLYSYALTKSAGKEEAQKLVKLANSYKVKPNFLVIDMEDADQYKKKHGMPSNQTLREICTIACETFQKAGYIPVIYASTSWFKNQLKGLNKFEKWVAHWPVKNGKQTGNGTASSGENSKNCAIWQFTSEGRLTGYNGRLDMNYAYKTFVVKADKPKEENKKEDKKKKTVGQIKVLGYNCLLYSKKNLTGTKYTYLKNTKVKILKNISKTVDYVQVLATGRKAYINTKYYK